MLIFAFKKNPQPTKKIPIKNSYVKVLDAVKPSLQKNSSLLRLKQKLLNKDLFFFNFIFFFPLILHMGSSVS